MDSLFPVLLMIDTATSVCSVALSQGEVIIGERTNREATGQHASLAAPMAQELLDEVQRRGLCLDGVVLSQGPGSYTGLRIGSALAKGLCHGFGIPLIAVSTLELMADGYRRNHTLSDETYIYPMIDARRMEVYTALFGADGKRLSDDAPRILSADAPLQGLGERPCVLLGDGASKAEGLWQGERQIVDTWLPEAKHMLHLGLEAYKGNRFVDLAYWTPSYLKEYKATIATNKVLGR